MRGFHAPPRKSTAPDSRTRAAHSSVCVRDSTAQGPAIATMRRPPMRTGCAGAAEADDRVVLAELAGGQLVRRGDGDDAGHAGEQLHLPHVHALDADGAEDGLLLTDDLPDRVSLGGQELADAALVLVLDRALENDDHGGVSRLLNPTGAADTVTLFRPCSLDWYSARSASRMISVGA